MCVCVCVCPFSILSIDMILCLVKAGAAVQQQLVEPWTKCGEVQGAAGRPPITGLVASPHLGREEAQGAAGRPPITGLVASPHPGREEAQGSAEAQGAAGAQDAVAASARGLAPCVNTFSTCVTAMIGQRRCSSLTVVVPACGGQAFS